MYSMVLMMALTGSGDVPDWGRRGGCHGCWGGCHGCWGGCHGCWGGCYGCWGGCYGCWGGCWGGCYGGARVAWGGGYAMPAYAGGGYVMPTYAASTPVLSSNGMMAAAPGTTTYQSGYFSPGTEAGEAPATIVVRLPADARLTIDGKATQSTGDTRTFQTPPLEPGRIFSYQLEAVAERNGQKERVTQRVEVQAGRPSEVTLNFPASRERRE
jgi:uncharacterized protein (TIGR03000 family)